MRKMYHSLFYVLNLDRLVIIPNGDVIGHLTRPLMFLCAQPNGLNATFDWFINETNIRNLDFFFSTKNGPYSSKLHFRQLMVSLNNSMIRCEGVLEDENRQFSPSTTLMIQGNSKYFAVQLTYSESDAIVINLETW